MTDCRIHAFYKPTLQWYRLVQDDEGRIAYLKVDESEIRKGDARTEIPEHCGMVGTEWKLVN